MEKITEVTKKVCEIMNGERGQKITELILEEVLEKKPNMTLGEWQECKKNIIIWGTAVYLRENGEAREEIAKWLFEEFNK